MVVAPADTKRDGSTHLLDLLRTLLADEAEVRRILGEGLRNARRADLPRDGDEILRFAWAHLMTPVAEALGVRAATQFISDLQAAIEHDRPSSTVRVPATSDVRAARHMTSEPFPSSDEPPTQRPSAKAPAARRLSVLLIDGDRLGRSSLARALVQARIDVRVADDATGAAEALDDLASPVDVVLADADAADFDRVVVRVQLRRPGLRIIARARPPASAHESGTRPVRPGVAALVWKTTRAADLIEQLRALGWDESG
jgi:hypothetical protein